MIHQYVLAAPRLLVTLAISLAVGQSGLMSTPLPPCLAMSNAQLSISSEATNYTGVQSREVRSQDLCSKANLGYLLCKSEEVVKTPPANGQDAEAAKPLLAKTISKSISKDLLSKITTISVSVSEQGRTVKYSGAPLRALLKEEISAIDDMPEWKRLAKQKIMLEVLGKDGFPALMSAVEVATNQSGDRFVLATEADGKPIEIKLICPNDEHHTRWVRDCEMLKLFTVDQ